jgi:hypothetical protein
MTPHSEQNPSSHPMSGKWFYKTTYHSRGLTSGNVR